MAGLQGPVVAVVAVMPDRSQMYIVRLRGIFDRAAFLQEHSFSPPVVTSSSLLRAGEREFYLRWAYHK